MDFTQEEIAAFLAECGAKPNFTVQDLTDVIPKNIEDLTYKDIRILFAKMGLLSDTERYKFRHILVFENMTSEEIKKYQTIYPPNREEGDNRFDWYFPTADKVEENYAKHFTQGR